MVNNATLHYIVQEHADAWRDDLDVRDTTSTSDAETSEAKTLTSLELDVEWTVIRVVLINDYEGQVRDSVCCYSMLQYALLHYA
jgi:hypothetical protein